MSDNGFIKLKRSQDTEYLLQKHPNAFLLLTLISIRARRYDGNPDGLQIGECYIGDWKTLKFTEQEYRTAKAKLCQMNFINIVETNRTRKNSTTGSTTSGTKVKLINSDIYDINSNIINDRINDRTTTEQRLSNDEEERTRNKEIKKKEQEDPQVASLLADFKSSLLSILPELDQDSLKDTKQQKSAMGAMLKNHGEDKVRAMFKFAHKHHFWQKHVHKPTYMKLKWNQLLAEMLQNPKIDRLTNNKTRALEKFKNGEQYSGYECNISEKAISFTALHGQGYHEVKLNENGFEDQLDGLVRKLKIK
jgi:hypothetical protein